MTESNRSNLIGKNNVDSRIGMAVSPDFSQKAILVYKKNLSGLSGFCRLVMYELFEYIDLKSGTIAINSLDILARTDFNVDSLRGRKKEDVTGDAIRNAFRSIKKAKQEHFIFKNVNQRIVIEMPFIRELYQSFYDQPSEAAVDLAVDLAADVATAKTHAQTSEKACFEPLLSEDVAGVLAAASLNPAINAHVKNKTLTNKQTNKMGCDSFADLKQPIRRDFYPNQETIELALSQGYVNVTNDIEIKRFITYNLASSTRWADYNPVFLNWLERANNNQRNAAVTTKSISRPHHLRKNHEQRMPINSTNNKNPSVADSLAQNRRIIAEENSRKCATNDFIEGEYCKPLALPY